MSKKESVKFSVEPATAALSPSPAAIVSDSSGASAMNEMLIGTPPIATWSMVAVTWNTPLRCECHSKR